MKYIVSIIGTVTIIAFILTILVLVWAPSVFMGKCLATEIIILLFVYIASEVTDWD